MKRGGRLDGILTLLFMLLAIGAVVCYFAVNDNPVVYLTLGCVAVVLRIVHYIMRFF
ncbi:MAG: hypothetical protein LBD53_05415 [Tannerella sp.]|jgi:hypothetical protein|nr:hypothetical protein [Tannerella sp.]